MTACDAKPFPVGSSGGGGRLYHRSRLRRRRLRCGGRSGNRHGFGCRCRGWCWRCGFADQHKVLFVADRAI